MTEQERYRKTDEVIAMFKRGEFLYKNSALFNTIVQQLVRGMDPYEVIESVISNCEDTSEAFKQHIIRCGPSMLIQYSEPKKCDCSRKYESTAQFQCDGRCRL